jgi:hypothetical protein
MNLQQIAQKYKINEHKLDNKEAGLDVVVKSLEDIQFRLQYNMPKEQLQENIKTLIQFCKDVRNSTF